MAPELPKHTFFTVPGGKSRYKYIAHVPIHGDFTAVGFGDRRYDHFRDQVPRELGGGRWSHMDHNDHLRRKSYIKRHSAISCGGHKKCIHRKYSPAWFSYHFLW
jgi:hypothetical protein